jgi:hypothetical protein
MQQPCVSHAAPRRPTRDTLECPQAKSITAKLTETGGAIKRARFDTSPELVDELENLESKEDVALLALIDRHGAEIA